MRKCIFVFGWLSITTVNLLSQQYQKFYELLVPSLSIIAINHADLDNDGFKEIIVSGLEDGESLSVVLKYNGNTFERLDNVFPNAPIGEAVFVHIDGDNLIDVVFTQETDIGNNAAVYLNQGGLVFSRINGLEENVVLRGVNAVDIENDGVIELIDRGGILYTLVQANDVKRYIPTSDIATDIHLYEQSNWVEADLNADGFKDLVLFRPSGKEFNTVFINKSGSLEPNNFQNEIVSGMHFNTADIDADGLPEIVYVDYIDNKATLNFLKWMGGEISQLVDMQITLVNVPNELKIEDYDLDGDLDILLLNLFENEQLINKVLINNNGVFDESTTLFIDNSVAKTDWLDFDNDGDLDVVFFTYPSVENTGIVISRNQLVEGSSLVNQRPTPPVQTTAEVSETGVKLSWTKASDNESEQAALLYNVVVEQMDGTVVFHSMSSDNDLKTNTRGQTSSLSLPLTCMPNGQYKWKVQAVDQTRLVSPFSDFGTFTIDRNAPTAPSSPQVIEASSNSVSIQWLGGQHVTQYRIFRKLSSENAYPLLPLASVDAETLAFTDSNLESNLEYDYKIEGYSCGFEAPYVELSVTTSKLDFNLLPIEVIGNIEDLFAANLADFNNDGRVDIFISALLKNGQVVFSIYEQKSDGSYLEHQITRNSLREEVVVVVTDYNNDGLMDLAQLQGSLELFLNKGDFNLELMEAESIGFPGSNGIGFFDINNDLKLEYPTPKVSEWKWLYYDILKPQSEPIFIQKVMATTQQLNKPAENVELIDVNRDGKKDFLFVYYDRLVLLTNTNSGYDESTYFKIGEGGILDVISGDFNSGNEFQILVQGTNESQFSLAVCTMADGQLKEQLVLTENLVGNPLVADFNNDGLSDIVYNEYVLNGTSIVGKRTIIAYSEKDSNSYTFQRLPDYGVDLLALADKDNDGDLDILVSQYHSSLRYTTMNWLDNYLDELDMTKLNSSPSKVKNLTLSPNHALNTVRIQWESAEDNESESNKLHYEISIKDSEGNYLIAPWSTANGLRLTTERRNFVSTLETTINCIPNGVYTVSVQAIDNGFRASELDYTATFEMNGTAPVAPIVRYTHISDTKVLLEWTDRSVSEQSYRIYPFELNGETLFSNEIPANSTSYLLENLLADTEYSFKVVPYHCAFEEAATIVTFKTYPLLYTETNVLDGSPFNDFKRGDFDNDGTMEIVYLSGDEGNELNILKYVDGNWVSSRAQVDQKGPVAGFLTTIDFDGDGLLDVAHFGNTEEGPKLSVFLNKGNFRFEIKNLILSLASGFGIRGAPIWVDFDHDGDIDVVCNVTNQTGFKESTVFLSNEGDFFKERLMLEGFSIGGEAFVDLDNDGDKDLFGHLLREPVLLYNDGKGNFKLSEAVPLVGAPTLRYYKSHFQSVWSDFDRNGYLDLMYVGDLSSNPSIVYFTQEDGQFSLRSDFQGITLEINHLNVADIDHDGDLDVILMSYYPFFYVNSGDGSFERMRRGEFENYVKYGMATASIVEDFNGDGSVDIFMKRGKRLDYYLSSASTGWGRTNNPPAKPNNLWAYNVTTGVLITWDDAVDDLTPKENMRYHVHLKYEDDGTILNPRYDNNQLNKTKNDLLFTKDNQLFIKRDISGRVMSASIQAIDANGLASAFSYTLPFDLVTGLNEGSSQVKMNISPNPTSEIINITYEGGYIGNVTLDIVNVEGRIVKQVETHKSSAIFQESLRIENLKPGIYTLRVREKKETKTARFIKLD
jgi:hypothetical protein